MIGKKGVTIRQIVSQSGAELSVAKPASDVGGGSGSSKASSSSQQQRRIDLTGLPHQIEAARAMIEKLLAGVGAAPARKCKPSADSEPTYDEPKAAETVTVIVAAWIDEPNIEDVEWW